ncbi:MAG: iron-containing alcohol dehydrogenase [Nitrospira sp.]|nr:iron-containing alcohol dehydrogenase [Nitrospira sp.]
MNGGAVFHIGLQCRAVCGAGAAEALPAKLAELKMSRIGVIVDEVVLQQDPIQVMLAGWRKQGLSPVTVMPTRTGIEPDYEYLDQVAATFRPLEVDLIIGVGGGSTMDLAKGVGILMRNPGRGIAYRGMNLVPTPGVPVVVIPTVAGSGSEVSATASFIDVASQTKLGINGTHVGCFLAVLDPQLLTTCPAGATIGSGLDALVHATEACTAKTANPVSLLFGAEAVRLLFRSLPKAVEAPADLEARQDLLLASFLAGTAMGHAAGGPTSGISYPLGVHYRVPHGYAGGILLPFVIAANVEKGYAGGYAALFEKVAPVDAAGLSSPNRHAAGFRDAVWRLYAQVQAPKNFRRWQVGPSAVDGLTDLTVAQRQGNLDLNPVPFGREDVAAVVRAACA